MSDPKLDSMPPEQKKRNLLIMYAGMAVSPVIYTVMCELILRYVFARQGHMGFVVLKPEVYSVVRTVLYTLSAVSVVVLAGVRIAINAGTSPGLVGLFLKAATKSKGDDLAMATVFTSFILTLCMNIGVFGFLLFLLNGSRMDAYPLAGLCLLMILMFMPTDKYIEKLAFLRKNTLMLGNNL
jgi:hypothetical protein